MEKTLPIDLSSGRLLDVAEGLIEEHNYISALKILNKNAALNSNDEESYMLYAEIFDDIGLYEKCINGWFRYLDCATCCDFYDAYEGLAVSYMNLGNEHFSAYYYNKLLTDADDLDAEEKRNIMDAFLSRERNPLKFVYPPRLADCSDIITEGVDYMKQGEYDKAVDEFEKVDEGNAAYLSARNYIAMCKIISDKCSEAEAECLAVLKNYPDNVQALTTLAAVKTEQKKSDEGRALALRLLSLNVTSTDDLYKIATVCCENKLHAEAYGLFCKLEKQLFYDSSVLYFKAVSAFNCGKVKESFSSFDKLLTIYPDAVTARVHYRRAREAAEKGENNEMSYFYRLPQQDRESSLKVLAAFSTLKPAEAEKFTDIVDITDCILWAFDETEGSGNGDLQFLASLCAVKARLDGIVRDILLNAFLPDELKVRILTLLGERNEENSFGVVVCHLYKKINFRALNVGRLKKKNFVSAYSRLTAHFGIIEGYYGEEFALAAENLYSQLKMRGNLQAAADTDALTAAVYFKSGIKEPRVTRKKLSTFFDAPEEKISDILGDL